MGKLTNLIMLMSGVLLLFYIGGVLEGTASSTLLNWILNPEKLKETPLALKIGSIIAAALAVGATVLAIVQKSDFLLMIPFVTIMVSFAWDFLAIYTIIASINNIVAVLIFGPIFIVYLITVLEWWRGIAT